MADETTKPAPRGRGAKGEAVAAAPVDAAEPATEGASSYIDGIAVQDATKFKNEATEEVRLKLEGQEKLAFFIPLSMGENPASRESVSINGFQLSIAKNISVLLPKQVYDMLRELYNIEANIGADRVGQNSGKPLRLDGQVPPALA